MTAEQDLTQALPRVPARPAARPAATRGEPVGTRARSRAHVLVIDDKGIMRDALCSLLADLPDVAFVSGAPIGAEALRTATNLRPDVVILELPPAAYAGLRLIAALKNASPSPRVIVLTWRNDPQLVESALRAGADGYLLKSDGSGDLRDALATVIGGARYLSAAVSAPAGFGLERAAGGRAESERTVEELTDRERQVIRLIASGHRTREIAQALSLSHKTIEKHRTSLMRKLKLRNAAAVTAYAIAHGFAAD